MGATAQFDISCTQSGFPESGTNAGFHTTYKTTQAVGEWRTTVVTTDLSIAPAISVPSSGSLIYIKPVNSTNTWPFRIHSATAAGVGVLLSSIAPSLIGVTTVASTYFLHTTASSGAGGPTPSITVRIGIY